MLALLHTLKEQKIISEINYQFAKLIDRKQQGYNYSSLQQNLAVFLAALVSFNVMQGHSAVRLSSNAVKNPFGLREYHPEQAIWLAEILQKIEQSSPLEWQEILADHIAFSHDATQVAPMLFQGELIYFYRYWQAEQQIACYLQQAVETETENANVEEDRAILARLFGSAQADETDWQKVAVATALRKRFCVISGGPGTGKTRTVARLLAALQLKQQAENKGLLNIALVAPTGKAAARLKESIIANWDELDLPWVMKEKLEINALTIHRLLGIRPQCDQPIYHQKNPLHLDLLVVDEASMIDLFLMEKLMSALKPSTRLIMLGDKDQLASVEAGAIMAQLGYFITQGYSQVHTDYVASVTGYQLTAQSDGLAIRDSLCHLRKSFRFDENSGIGLLAKEVNAQQAVKSWQTIANGRHEELEYVAYPAVTEFAEKSQWVQHCADLVVQKAVTLYRDYLQKARARECKPEVVSVEEIFNAFQKVRFLAALRVSELGVNRLNQRVAEALQNAKLVKFGHSRESYVGKPILITENAPQHHIYSGDIGIILPDESGALRVYFDTKVNGDYLSLSISRVPAYEPAYVMTVHKSQGSEFEHTLFVMPLASSPVLTKELVYTAITRAKEKFTLFGDEKTWMPSIKAKVQRQSGLQEQLIDIFS
ncbi:exodeoxyribonuclease V subunit alpha [Haemophilus paraphrohaemolyticus]|uniref:RecBCD enzyme subunit RecD n=2 Tax=Haemophilus TaxID=724 RepID=I2NED4_9PAST|nr:exodeoxyribonuclease V subunit alpha [Haemophilus paraphrohaemolyticus]EIG24195.1 exodeoxyribonuclease V, alpha subunit [Haemophilus paraphrohaemolyticus HK411]OOR95068.1 exodeoxyribonuclease V subunit alpha [Haemophilus paraphrohaemolyticus]STP02139.1 Exodeoxyribonuclease V alpha chain [Haemophilus paraphrohaemolyticus]